MSTITSSLGKTSFSSNQRVFSVPDESQFEIPSDAVLQSPKILGEKEMTDLQAARQEAYAAQKKIAPEIKNRLEALLGIGRDTCEVKIGEFTFTLQTLKTNENKACSTNLPTLFSASDQIHELRTQTLARAIFKINGIEAKYVLGSDKIEDMLDFVWNLGDIVSEALYAGYAQMRNRVQERLLSVDILQELKKSSRNQTTGSSGSSV